MSFNVSWNRSSKVFSAMLVSQVTGEFKDEICVLTGVNCFPPLLFPPTPGLFSRRQFFRGLRGVPDSPLAGALGDFDELGFHSIQFLLGKIFQVNHGILGLANRADNFIQLDLQRQTIAILTVLNDEHHKEGAYRGSRIDYHLPAIREAEIRTA